MEISNEEMEVLNRASEILSKYAAQGGLSRADFDHYESMVISIIDSHGEKSMIEAETKKRREIGTLSILLEEIAKQKQNDPMNQSHSTDKNDGCIHSEKLKSGGMLCITKNGCSIDYSYPGSYVSIKENMIDQYIEAWKNNLKRYYELKRTIALKQNITVDGEMGMIICVGQKNEGVFLRKMSLCAKTPIEIDHIVSDYKYAKMRSNQILSK